MTETKPKVNAVNGDKCNMSILKVVGVARGKMVSGREQHDEVCVKGVTVIKSGLKYGVSNMARVVLDTQFESVVILENGWLVACQNGIYKLYDKEGNVYKGLSFLKKDNAIKFAKTL